MTGTITVGSRVRLLHDEDRYPHFVAPAGSVGTVTHADDNAVCVRLHNYLPGAEEWDNEVHWYPIDGDDPAANLQVLA